MIENLREIKKDELLAEVQKFADKKARLVVAVCNDLGDKFETTYFFNYSPGMDMKAIRICTGKEEEIPSISKIYLAAVLNENEIKETFGAKIKDIAIDFGGYMLLAEDSPKLPMLKEKAAEKKGSD